jgi:hypothetical protein
MPSFFARRYMRKQVSMTERLIGVVVLAGVAGIVVAVLDTVRASDRKLFDLGAKYVRSAEEPRESRVAAAMMPVLANWKMVQRVEAKRADAAGDWLGEHADAFRSNGLVWAYRGRLSSGAGVAASAIVTVFDMGAPENARAICKALRPAGAAECGVGRDGWSANMGAGEGRIVFWNGRYCTEVDGRGVSAAEATKAATDIAQAAASIQLSYGLPPAAPPIASTGPVQKVPTVGGSHFPEVAAGWRRPVDVKRYDKDTLYEKIDGKAGMFIGYMFVELQFGVYENTSAGEPYDVYVYDMDEPLNAFGIYRLERSRGATTLAIGREGYTSGPSTFCWKGKYYVNVLGPQDKAGAGKRAEELATAVAATIEDDGKPFWADAVFPRENRKPDSLSYKATDALGYGFLRQVFLADYAVDGKEYQLFVHRAVDAAAAKALFDQYDAVAGKNAVNRSAGADGAMVVSESLGVFEAAFHKGPLFAGLTECEDKDLALRQVEAFRCVLDPAAVEGVPAPIAPQSAPAASQPAESSESSHGESESAGG